jgi:hypothetical protein
VELGDHYHFVFGYLAAIDFQARSMAAKTGFGARISNFLAGLLCVVIGIPISYVGSIMRCVGSATEYHRHGAFIVFS